MGASVAYRLLQHGADVTVVDRGDAGQATAAAAGILPPLDHFIGVEAVLPLLKASRAYYPQLLAELAAAGEEDVGYEVVGALHVATNEEQAARLPAVAAACERRRESGFAHIGAVTQLSAVEARRRVPILGASLVGAVHCEGAARIDGRRLLAALRAASARRGASWLSGDAQLQLDAGRVTAVRTNGLSLPADAVVITAGAWSQSLAAALGIQLPVRPQRGQLIHLELPGVSTARWPMVMGFSTSYLLGFPEQRLVAGATRELGAGFDHRWTAGGVHEVLGDALRLAPELARATLKEARVGFRPLSADGKPILGAPERYPNVYFATGHGGYGIEVGPFSGALLADLVMGQPGRVDLAPFAVDRFGPEPALSPAPGPGA